MISFPTNPPPQIDDTYTAAGKTWKWTGVVWQLQPRTLTSADITGLQTVLDGKQASGSYATLDGGGKVPSTQLPSYVDDVIEAANFAALPAPGEAGKIYVTIDNAKTFRWSGSAYIEISSAPGSTDSVAEGSANLYFTTARAAAAAPVQKVAGRTGEVVLGISDVTDLQTSLDGKQIKTFYSDTAPAHAAGLEWVDTTSLRSYRSYNGVWVEIDRA
jgi:hypothetical protein